MAHRIAIISDHRLIAWAFRKLIVQRPTLEAVAELTFDDNLERSLASARAEYAILHFDCLPAMAAALITRAGQFVALPRQLIMLPAGRLRLATELANRGTGSVVLNSDSVERLGASLDAMVSGRFLHSPIIETELTRLAAQGVDEIDDEYKDPLDALSPREHEVLRLISQGMSKRQIAEQLSLSVKTIDNHATSLMSKLDIHDRVGLARFAFREGLVEP